MTAALPFLVLVPVAAGLVIQHRQRTRSEREIAEEAERKRVRTCFPEILMEAEERNRVTVTKNAHRLEWLRSEEGKVSAWFASVKEKVAGDRPLLWVTFAAVVVGFIWLVAFRELVDLDRAMFRALGINDGVESRSRHVAIGVSLLGILIFDLCRSMPIIIGVARVPLLWRRVLASTLALALASTVFLFLPRIAEARSYEIEHRVIQLEANRVALEARPARNSAALQKLDGEIDLEAKKLKTARFADQFLIAGAVVAEVLSSWALMELFGLLVLAGLAVRIVALTNRIHQIEGDNRALPQQMVSELARMGIAVGLSRDYIRFQLREYLGEGPDSMGDDDPPPRGRPPDDSPGPPLGSSSDDGVSSASPEGPPDPAPQRANLDSGGGVTPETAGGFDHDTPPDDGPPSRWEAI